MIINQKTFLKNDKNPETEANPVAKNWNRGKHFSKSISNNKNPVPKNWNRSKPRKQKQVTLIHSLIKYIFT